MVADENRGGGGGHWWRGRVQWWLWAGSMALVGEKKHTHSREEEKRVCGFDKTTPILKYEMSKLFMVSVLC